MQPSIHFCFKASFSLHPVLQENAALGFTHDRIPTTQTLNLNWDYRTKQAALCVAVLHLHTAVIVWRNHKEY